MNIQRTNVRRGGYPSDQRRYHSKFRLKNKLVRQLDYLQRTLAIFLTNSTNMSEQFESLLDELIKENKQINKLSKSSPESISSVLQTTANAPYPLSKKRSTLLTINSKLPSAKRLKSNTTKDDDDDILRKKQEIINTDDMKDDYRNDDEDRNVEIKFKSFESQTNQSSSRDIDEFAIELGLVCNKCMLLAEEKDNRLVECHECHDKYHQKCHRPPVSTADISDPRYLWYCSKCRRLINKRQQSQSSIKEIKTSNNSSSLIMKSKTTESISTTGKKSISNSITDIPTGLFSFKTKSSDSTISDTLTINNPSISNSNSSLTNGNITKNTNGWASLATGFKEKKTTSDMPNTNRISSASSILAELTALTASNNSSDTKSSLSSSNSSLKQSVNGSSTISSFKSDRLSLPPVSKSQISSSLKSTQKLLLTSKNLQRVSSPMPLGRQTSIVKASSSDSNSSSSTTNTNIKIATNLDYEKRLKQMKKIAAAKRFN